METRHPVDGSFRSEFTAICNHYVVIAAWRSKTLKFLRNFCFFWKERPLYGKIFIILFRKFSLRHWSTLVCVNFVKFGRREMGEIVRYLPDKKKFRLPVKLSLLRADRAQNLPGQAPNNVLRVLQISSKSVHFRQL